MLCTVHVDLSSRRLLLSGIAVCLIVLVIGAKLRCHDDGLNRLHRGVPADHALAVVTLVHPPAVWALHFAATAQRLEPNSLDLFADGFFERGFQNVCNPAPSSCVS